MYVLQAISKFTVDANSNEHGHWWMWMDFEKRMNEWFKNIIHLFLNGVHPFSNNNPLWMDRLSIGWCMNDIHPCLNVI